MWWILPINILGSIYAIIEILYDAYSYFDLIIYILIGGFYVMLGIYTIYSFIKLEANAVFLGKIYTIINFNIIWLINT